MKTTLIVFIMTFCCIRMLQSQQVINLAANFTGASGYYATPDHPDIKPSTAATFEFWIKVNALGAVQGVIGKNYLTGYMIGIQPDGRIFFETNTVQVANSTALLTVGNWTHVAVVYSSGTTTFYFNGVSGGTSAGVTGNILQNTDSLFIGADRNGATPAYFLNAQLKNVRIWKDVAKPIAQIQQNRYINLAISGTQSNSQYDGLTFSVPFDAFGAIDLSGTIQSLYTRGAATATQLPTPTPISDYNNNVYFDGTSYISVANIPDFNPTTAVTLEAWVKRDTLGTQNASLNIINKSGGTQTFHYALWVQSDGMLVFSINSNAGLVSKLNAVTLGKWYHVAGTYSQSSGIMKLYVNGDSVASSSYSGQIAATPDSVFIGGIGASNYFGNKFKGQIDCPRIWKDTVVSTQGIKINMYKNFLAATGKPVEFSLDGNNLVRGLSSGYYANLMFIRGIGATYTSSHINSNPWSTSPILRDDAGGFPNNYFVSTNRLWVPEPGFIVDSVFVPPASGGNISNLKMFVLLNHTYDSDMRLYLTGPLGQVAQLTPVWTGVSQNDIMTIFDGAADSTISNSPTMPPFSPKVKPANPLTVFNGTNASGWWKLRLVDSVGADRGYLNGWGVYPSIVTGNNGNVTELPDRFYINQNFPNPFNPTTTIKFGLARDIKTRITVYDLLGREVTVLLDEVRKAGAYEITFNASFLSSGVYFYKIEAGDFIETRKMMLIK